MWLWSTTILFVHSLNLSDLQNKINKAFQNTKEGSAEGWQIEGFSNKIMHVSYSLPLVI